MFIAALFTMAKLWKQPKSPSTDEWIKNIYIYIYIHIHSRILLRHKNNEILPFAATWIGLENIILSEISYKDKYSMTSIICGI